MINVKKTTAIPLIALLLVSTFVLDSCKKKNIEYTIEGTLSDKSFNTNLAGATIKLYVTEVGNTSLIEVGSVTTGSDGKYSFKIKREKYESISISFSKDNYFEQQVTTSIDNLSVKETNTFNFDCYAKSWVRIHITGNGINDCRYIRQEGYSGCAECCPTTYQYFNTPIDTSVYCINKGNTLYQVYYNVMQTPTQGPVGVTTVPFDTTELLIAY